MMRLLALVLLLLAPVHAQSVETRVLMRGTGSQTVAQIARGAVSGPTIMIIGGVHGDEPAGFLAPREMLSWRPKNGVLVVVSDANPQAIRRRTRFWKRNMNRLWPGKPHGDENERLAFKLWKLTRDFKPDLLLTTHESRDFYARNRARYGQTLTFDFAEFQPKFQEIAGKINRGITPKLHRFLLKIEAFETCPTFVTHKFTGAMTCSIETSKTLPLSLRITYQKRACRIFMESFGMNIEIPRLVH